MSYKAAVRAIAPSRVQALEDGRVLAADLGRVYGLGQGPRGLVGINWRREFNENTQYTFRDAVEWLGSSYFVYAPERPPVGTLPSDTDYWDLIAQAGGPDTPWLNAPETVPRSTKERFQRTVWLRALDLYLYLEDDDPDLETKALHNAAQIATALQALSDAGGGVLQCIPRGTVRVAASVYEGAHRITAGDADSWSKVAIPLDGLSNITIEGHDCRFLRLESEVTGGGIADQRNATFGIYRSNDILFRRVRAEGHQTPDVKNDTTGNNFDVSWGSYDISFDHCTFNKGTNGFVFGLNVDKYQFASGFGTAIEHAVHDISLVGCKGWNCEHGMLINIAFDGRCDSFHHNTKTYSFGGVVQTPYIQRCVYFNGCRNWWFGAIQSYGAHKAAILFALYDASRTFSDLEGIRIDAAVVQAPGDQGIDTTEEDEDDVQDGNQYVGLAVIDATTGASDQRRYLRNVVIGSYISKGCKRAVWLREGNYDSDLNSATSASILGLTFQNVDISATVYGIAANTFLPIEGLRIESGRIRVFSDLDFSSTAKPASGISIVSRRTQSAGVSANDNTFHKRCYIGGLDIQAGDRPVQLLGHKGLTISGLVSQYIFDNVAAGIGSYSSDAWDIVADICGDYGEINYRMGNGTSPAVLKQNTILQAFPRMDQRAAMREIVSINFSSIPAHGALASDTTWGITGALATDFVQVVCLSHVEGLIFTAVMEGDGFARVYAHNYTATPIDPPSLNFSLRAVSKTQVAA